jgi:molybdopterin-guanine dinucleotide biosynthesis protein A
MMLIRRDGSSRRRGGDAFPRYPLTLARDADAVVPRTERGYHPLCAAYTRSRLPAAAARLAGPRLNVVGLLEGIRVRVVTTEEIEAFDASWVRRS